MSEPAPVYEGPDGIIVIDEVSAMDQALDALMQIRPDEYHALMQSDWSPFEDNASSGVAMRAWRGRARDNAVLAAAEAWAPYSWRAGPPKRPKAEVTLPWEKTYVTGEGRKEMAQRLREVADLVEAGYNLHAAESCDYDRTFRMRFELSGEPIVDYPTDNSPALGGQKETT